MGALRTSLALVTPSKLLGLLLMLLAALGMALLPLNLAAALALGAAIFLLTLLRREYALYLLAFSIPFGSLREVRFGPASLTATEFLVAALVASWAIQVLASHDGRIRFTGLFWPSVLYLGLLSLSATSALSLSLGLKEVLKWLEFLAIYLVAANSLERPQQRNLLFAAILAAGLLEALLGWYQFLGRVGPPGFLLAGRFLRAYGTFGQPNPYAGYLDFVWPLGYGLLLSADLRNLERPRVRWLILAAFCLFFTGMAVFMSFSRAGLLASAAAFAVMSALRSRRFLMVFLILLLVLTALGLLGMFNLLPASLTARLAVVTENFALFDARNVIVTPENWSIVERMATWQAAWAIFEAHPILGVGVGNFGLFYKDFALPLWESLPKDHAHNYYLNLLAETGVLGLTAYLVLLLAVLVFIGKVLASASARPKSPQSLLWAYPLALANLGVLVALSLHNLFDNVFVHGMTVQWGLTLGLLAAAMGDQEEGGGRI